MSDQDKRHLWNGKEPSYYVTGHAPQSVPVVVAVQRPAMNKQKIMELVDEYGHLKHSQGMDDNSDFADRRRNANSTGEEADEIRAAIEAALPDVPTVPESVISGALFDFAGYLTTLDESVTFGSFENASPMVEHLQAWAKKRELSLDDADVQHWPAMLSAAPVPAQAEQHPDDIAVDRYASALKQKLGIARTKGRGGWQTCSNEDLSRMLREHVEKGDPRDVANFCMFLWSLGHGIAQAEQPRNEPVQQAPVMIYHGRCVIDCGDNGHHDVELLRMIPAGTKLYTSPQTQPMTFSQVSEEVKRRTSLHTADMRWAFIEGIHASERFHKIGG